MFGDGTKGSPVIALEVLTNYLNSAINKNFTNLRIVATEKNEENQTQLKQNIEKIMNFNSVANQIQFYTSSSNILEDSRNAVSQFLFGNNKQTSSSSIVVL